MGIRSAVVFRDGIVNDRAGAKGMIDEKTLQEVVQRIIVVAHPSRVILFGSYGRGDADAGSDLDVMVIKPHVTDQYGDMIRLHKAIGDIGVGVDVLVYSDKEFQRRSQVPGTVLYWARKEGRAVYEAPS
jgi:predicted nucleotidyltransferase